MQQGGKTLVGLRGTAVTHTSKWSPGGDTSWNLLLCLEKNKNEVRLAF